MCSCRTYVPMIACILIPGFELQRGAARPAAARAEARGARAAARDRAGARARHRRRRGSRRAARDAARRGARHLPVARPRRAGPGRRRAGSGKQIVRRLEDDGFAVEPVEPGCLYFDTRGVERLYGGVAAALKRALAAVGTAWDACAGAADRRFAALAAAAIARPGQALVVSDDRTQGVPRAAAADAASARRRAARGARAARGQEDRTACRAAGCRRCRTIGAGRPARLEPGEG